MPSTLLGIARGTLKGFGGRDEDARRRKEEARQRERQELDDLIRLSQAEGITLEDPPAPQLPAPTVGSAGAQRGVLDAARGAWKRSAAGDMPGAPAPVDPTQRPANIMEIGRTMVGGREKVVHMDPEQTVGGQKRAARKENKAAFDRVNTDGSLGAYDPGVDYRGEERKKLNQAEIERELVASGVDPKDAHLLAEHHVDMEGRRTKTAAAKRAGERETEQSDIRRATLEERKRHNRATEGTPGSGGVKGAKGEFAAVEKQIADTRGALAIAKRAIPKLTTLQEAGDFGSPKDSTAYRAARSAENAKISALEKRGDSLRVISDSLASVIQGKGGAATKPGADTAGMQRAYAKAAADYKAVLAIPGIDKAEALKAYDDTIALISRKYGAIK